MTTAVAVFDTKVEAAGEDVDGVGDVIDPGFKGDAGVEVVTGGGTEVEYEATGISMEKEAEDDLGRESFWINNVWLFKAILTGISEEIIIGFVGCANW